MTVNLKLLDRLLTRLNHSYREIGECVDRAITACRARGNDPALAMKEVLQEALADYNQRYPCVHCGYCCSVEACEHGQWDAVRGCCQFLTANHRCQRYSEIKDDKSIFGTGCADITNPWRRRVILRKKGDVE